MKLFVFFLSLAIAIGSFTAFAREYRIAYLSRSPDAAIFDQIAFSKAQIDLPLSARGMREVMTVCGDVQQGLVYTLQPKAIQDQIDARCGDIAARALVKNPTFSAAYTINMMSAPNITALGDNLILSQLTAPSESWNAKLRLLRGAKLFGTGRDDLDRALLADVGFLVQSGDGQSWLARLYKLTPSAQPLLIKAIDARPDLEKQRFLNEVRRLG